MTRGRLPRVTVEGVAPLPEKRWRTRLDGAEPIAYLRLKEISGSTPQEIRALAEQAESEGAKALILDLREVDHSSFHAGLLARRRPPRRRDDRPGPHDRRGPRLPRRAPTPCSGGGRWPSWSTTPAGVLEPETAWLVEALRDNRLASVVGDVTLGPSRSSRNTSPCPTANGRSSWPRGSWSTPTAAPWPSARPGIRPIRRAIQLRADGRVPPRNATPTLHKNQDDRRETCPARTSSSPVPARPSASADPLAEARAILSEKPPRCPLIVRPARFEESPPCSRRRRWPGPC